MPWLPSALDSILNQTLRDIEVVVLEDGSTDGTPAALAACRDPRVRVIPQDRRRRDRRRPQPGARGRAWHRVARQDADDESTPQRLARQAACTRRAAHVDVVATVADYMDLDGRPLDNEWVRANPVSAGRRCSSRTPSRR